MSSLIFGALGCGNPVGAPRASAVDDAAVIAVVIVSANAEWKPVRGLFPDVRFERSPFGEWFETRLDVGGEFERVVFVQGGWGKISAAASAQYVIDRWKPGLLVNLGTCGGFAGITGTGDTVLVRRTVVYDIVEKMGDPAEAIAAYSTTIDLSWLGEPLPARVTTGVIASGDRDLFPADLGRLAADYDAVAGDWESGAIAWVAGRNETRVLILRTVSDTVSDAGSDAYGNIGVFEQRSATIMKALVDALPLWLARHRDGVPRAAR